MRAQGSVVLTQAHPPPLTGAHWHTVLPLAQGRSAMNGQSDVEQSGQSIRMGGVPAAAGAMLVSTGVAHTSPPAKAPFLMRSRLETLPFGSVIPTPRERDPARPACHGRARRTLGFSAGMHRAAKA